MGKNLLHLLGLLLQEIAHHRLELLLLLRHLGKLLKQAAEGRALELLGVLGAHGLEELLDLLGGDALSAEGGHEVGVSGGCVIHLGLLGLGLVSLGLGGLLQLELVLLLEAEALGSVLWGVALPEAGGCGVHEGLLRRLLGGGRGRVGSDVGHG